MKYLKCINKIYDPFLDTWWVLFEVEDEIGKIQFRMPINEEDFEIGKLYKLKVKEYTNEVDR